MRGLPVAVATAVALLAGCSDDAAGPAPEPTTSPSAVAEPAERTPSPARLPRAEEPPVPETGACYRLSYDQALAPTSSAPAVGCDGPHDAVTIAVGRLDTVVEGHLLAVDSVRVRGQAAERCPQALADFLGGDQEDRRLSMLRTVWFTPTLAESDTGAEWYRCDVIALAADGELQPLEGDLRGVLGRPEGVDRYGMCGTAAPDSDSFARVTCAREHSWRTLRVVDLGTGAYPGEDAARAAGQAPCEDAGREAAADPLDFEWGYEWPTQEQWEAGQTYGRCWAPA